MPSTLGPPSIPSANPFLKTLLHIQPSQVLSELQSESMKTKKENAYSPQLHGIVLWVKGDQIQRCFVKKKNNQVLYKVSSQPPGWLHLVTLCSNPSYAPDSSSQKACLNQLLPMLQQRFQCFQPSTIPYCLPKLLQVIQNKAQWHPPL